jgi:hypothetical protein
LECVDCGRTTRGWLIGSSKEEIRVDKWVAIAAALPASGVFGWIVVRFIEWRRRWLASMSGGVQGES